MFCPSSGISEDFLYRILSLIQFYMYIKQHNSIAPLTSAGHDYMIYDHTRVAI